MNEAVPGERILHERPSLLVAGALDGDVRVVAERGGRGRLHGGGRHQPDVLAGLDEIRDEIGVAGVEADAHAGHVRTLRHAVHGEDVVDAGAQDRRRYRRELGVALVARDDDAALARPRRDRAEAGVVGNRRRRVAGLVHPQHERALGVLVAHRGQVEVPAGIERHRYRAAAGQGRAHLVGGVRDRGKQHGVAARDRAAATDAAASATSSLVPTHVPTCSASIAHAERPRDPRRRRVAQAGLPADIG